MDIYECADFFMLRRPTLNLQTEKELSSTHDLMQFYHASQLFQEAVAIASPSLHQSIRNCKSSQKSATSLLKYLIRMSSRPVPFGLFAAVGWGRFGNETHIDSDRSHLKKRARLNMGWLFDFLHSTILRDREVVQYLDVLINPQIVKKSKRLLLYNGKAIDSIKRSASCDIISTLAANPIRYSELQAALCAAFPSIDVHKIADYLWTFFKKGFLISEMSTTQAGTISVEGILNKLTNISTSLPGNLTEALELFKSALSLIQQYEKCAPGEGVSYLEKMPQALVHVDAYIDKKDFQLDSSIKQTIQKCVSLLWQCSVEDKSVPTKMAAFRSQFLEKYGTTRLIPLHELIHEDFVQALFVQDNEKPHSSNALDAFVKAKQKAVEVDLEEFVWSSISENDVQCAPASCELYFEQRSNGTFILGGLSAHLGSMSGRFFYLFDPSVKEMMKRCIEKEQHLFPDLIFVDATFFPEDAKTANVSLSHSFRRHCLSMEYHNRGENRLDLDDIFVGSTGVYLYLFSKKLGKEISVSLNNSVNPLFAPRPLQLILLLSKQRFVRFSFPWERIQFEVYTPRFRYQNIILSLAQWTFTYTALGLASDAKTSLIKEKLVEAFMKHEVPSSIQLKDGDGLLPLDLSEDHFLEIVLQQFLKRGRVELVERVADTEQFVSEFVVPVLKKSCHSLEPTLEASLRTYPPTEQLTMEERTFCPGSEWFYAKLYMPERESIDFLVSTLVPYIQTFDSSIIKKWFYVLYKDEKPHIRLRIHLTHLAIDSNIVRDIQTWLSRQVFERTLDDFTLCTYERETERWGGPGCIESVEQFFYADSLACCSLLSHTKRAFALEVIASFGIISILKSFYGELSKMINLLLPYQKENHLLDGFRPHAKAAIASAKNFLERRSEAMHALVEHVHLLEEKGMLWNTKAHLVTSLIHMHCNRLLGLSKELEKKSLVIALYILKKIEHEQHSRNL